MKDFMLLFTFKTDISSNCHLTDNKIMPSNSIFKTTIEKNN